MRAESDCLIQWGAILAVCSCLVGCDGLLSRSRPNQAEYLERYLPEISPYQVVHMDYTYKASVGGYLSLAKIQVAEVGQLNCFWRLSKDMSFDFVSNTRDFEIELLQTQFAVANGGDNDKKIPVWVDLKYDEPIYVFKDSVGKQRYRRFFLRKDCPVFYLLVAGN